MEYVAIAAVIVAFGVGIWFDASVKPKLVAKLKEKL